MNPMWGEREIGYSLHGAVFAQGERRGSGKSANKEKETKVEARERENRRD